MMEVQDAWQHYYEHSGAASAGARKLAFTGIALVWIFSGGGLVGADEVTIHGHYLWPLALLVLALGFDFAQYLYLSIAWRVLARHRETIDTEARFDAPWWTNTAGEVFFVVKLAFVVVGYVWLLIALAPEVL